MSETLKFLQAASNAVAGNVAGPVDLISAALNKLGLNIQKPVGGSEWMRQTGLMADVPQGAAQVAGETFGLLAPTMAVAKAPQIAKGLLQMGDNLAAPRTLHPETGAIVWHGSPHKFDKFDSSKIGTGEGAQAYGHGLYLAESPDTATFYKSALTDRFPARLDGKAMGELSTAQRSALGILNDYGGNVESALSFAKRDMQKAGSVGAEFHVERYNTLLDVKKGLAKAEVASPSLYKVDLPDDAIAKMLDWDKPLSQQTKAVQAWVKDPYNAYRSKLVAADVGGNEPTGNLIFNRLQELMNEGKRADVFTNQANYGAANASRELKDYGIPGIRYLDGGSRGAGAGTSNFVVFPGNEGLLTILERNGQALR